MPIYEYECEAGHTFEVLKRIGQMDISPCKYCSGKAHRILSPANFVLKGPGFYVNDYKKKAESPESSPGQEKAKPEKPEKGNGKDS
jgi:putative FmdB family regulatory protein